MIQKKYLFVLLILLVGFMLDSCKKQPPEYYITPDFKNWSCYKKGSYWIYLNEISGVQDCTWVTWDTNYVRYYGGGYEYDHRYNEYFETEVSSNLFDGFYTVAGRQDYTTINFYPSWFGKISYSYDMILDPVFYHRLYRNTIENIGIAGILPEEIIHGNTFYNVYDFRHEWISERLPQYGDSMVLSMHLVKNIGIVKLRKYQEGNDTTWSLLRWKVYQ
jgi:hypothetical protein